MLPGNTPLWGVGKNWSIRTYNPVSIRIILLHLIQMLLSVLPPISFASFSPPVTFFLKLFCFYIPPSFHLTSASLCLK